MDQVFFGAKRLHWTAVKFWRPALARFGLTPARFDLLHALTDSRVEKTQRALRVALGVARATISEMLAALERLGLIARSRHPEDRRTHRVELTAKGRGAFERAYDACIRSGMVSVALDASLTHWDAEQDPGLPRANFEFTCDIIRQRLGDSSLIDFYRWDPDDCVGHLDYAELFYLVDFVKLRPDAIRSSFRESAR